MPIMILTVIVTRPFLVDISCVYDKGPSILATSQKGSFLYCILGNGSNVADLTPFPTWL